jgi:hypothetical protein
MTTDNPALTRALIVGRNQLYQQSAEFHHAIDTLVAWLPLWIEALADQAERQQEIAVERARLLAAEGHPQ